MEPFERRQTMTKDDAKDLALSVLIVVAAALVADDVWLHWRIGKMQRDTEEQIATLMAEAERSWWQKCKIFWQEKWEEWRKD